MITLGIIGLALTGLGVVGFRAWKGRWPKPSLRKPYI